MSTVLFIEGRHGTERHFTRGFRLGAVRSGWKVDVVWLQDKSGAATPHDIIRRQILEARPELVVWIMDQALALHETLMTSGIREIPKAALWFDDYHRAYAIHQFREQYIDLARNGELKTYVWDGYWRKQFERNFGVTCEPIHLAADEGDYYPAEANQFKELDDHLIFIGNTPSFQYVTKTMALFPQPCQKLLQVTGARISKESYARLPYDLLEEVYQNLSAKERTTVDHFRSSLENRIVLNRLVWLLGKREVRLRILKLAARQKPVLILSGHSDRSFSEPAELAADLGETAHGVKFVNTSETPLERIGDLYHAGLLHLQATDPQSVEGGIPFRVFETAASERPLLSDSRLELKACFESEKEILLFESDQDFSSQLEKAIANAPELRALARRSRQRFLQEHTWKHRFQVLQQGMSTSSGL
jgi:hypothetical protein